MNVYAALAASLLLLSSCRHVGRSTNTLSDLDFAGNEPDSPPVVRLSPDTMEGRIYAAIETVGKNKPSRFLKTDVEAGAHKYLEDNGLIQNDEERKMGMMFSSRWGITRIVDHGDASVVLMNNHIVQGDDFVENQDGAWQVIALKQDVNGQFVFMPFEQAFEMPPSLQVALQSNPPEAGKKSFYYMEATGKSLIEIMKAIYSGQPIVGLKGKVSRFEAGLAAPDGRQWRLVEPEFDLRRGESPHVNDICPDTLDQSFDEIAGRAGYIIAPQFAGAVRKVLLAGKWIEVLPRELASKRRLGYEEE